LAKRNIPTLSHPPYNQEIAPCDFHLFPKLKSKLKGHHFGTLTEELRTLTENGFPDGYDQWKELWNHCVTSKGSYFEGDNLQFQVSLIYCDVYATNKTASSSNDSIYLQLVTHSLI
jgi:hypothetical protein